MATAQTIIDSVKARWKIKSADTASDTILLEYVNSAMHSIETMRRWHWLRRRGSIQVKIGVYLYPIPGGAGFVIQPHSLRDVRIQELQWKLACTEADRVYREDAGRTITGDPTHYWYDGIDETQGYALQVGFYPIPSAARTVSYSYTMVLLDLAASGTILMPDAVIPCLKDYTSWLWSQHNEKNEALTAMYQAQMQLKLQTLVDAEEMAEDRIVSMGGSPEPHSAKVPLMDSAYREILSEGEEY